MGLASKLAAAQAQGAPNPYGAPGGAPPPPAAQQQQSYGAPQGQPPQQSGGQSQGYSAPSGPPLGQSYGQQGQGQQQGGQYGQQQGSYGQQQGQQSQYGAPSGPPPGHQQNYGQQGQQQGQYGQQQPPQGQPPAYQASGAPPVAGAAGGPNSQAILQSLIQCVQEQKIQAFYPPGSLEPIAQRVAQSGVLPKLAQDWRMPIELASDLVKLSLFDVILYVDDSGSMAFEQGGERIDDLKLILSRVAHATSLFDDDGIQVRFMNNRLEGNGIKTEQQALQLVQQVKFSGLTPLGTSLWQKILQPLVLGPASQNRLQKPVLVVILTDGTPAGENRDEIFKVILRADSDLKRTRYGPDALSYQFAQIGDDMKAMKFLEELDNHPVIGGLIDCTSNYEAEQAEMSRKSGIDLTPEMWLVKLLMGGIDDSYDEKLAAHITLCIEQS
ncbi:uncharacterized protein IL334_000715 [Kwoniella shivajii]|uniref:VWFA domain-containing protein n=1 Tax=Kwoniella shivajii TaxID=564305 RepID=A0ABZ1CPX1_9TREE|nr:hypothetical protein IL334_000715 [Kwoniella shivajii]